MLGWYTNNRRLRRAFAKISIVINDIATFSLVYNLAIELGYAASAWSRLGWPLAWTLTNQSLAFVEHTEKYGQTRPVRALEEGREVANMSFEFFEFVRRLWRTFGQSRTPRGHMPPRLSHKIDAGIYSTLCLQFISLQYFIVRGFDFAEPLDELEFEAHETEADAKSYRAEVAKKIRCCRDEGGERAALLDRAPAPIAGRKRFASEYRKGAYALFNVISTVVIALSIASIVDAFFMTGQEAFNYAEGKSTEDVESSLATHQEATLRYIALYVSGAIGVLAYNAMLGGYGQVYSALRFISGVIQAISILAEAGLNLRKQYQGKVDCAEADAQKDCGDNTDFLWDCSAYVGVLCLALVNAVWIARYRKLHHKTEESSDDDTPSP